MRPPDSRKKRCRLNQPIRFLTSARILLHTTNIVLIEIDIIFGDAETVTFLCHNFQFCAFKKKVKKKSHPNFFSASAE